jgi:hypothetical protein
VSSFGHATRLVCPGTFHATEGLFLLKCNKLRRIFVTMQEHLPSPAIFFGLIWTKWKSEMFGFNLLHFERTIRLLREKFLDRLILLRGQSYSLRSCDLTLCDFFLGIHLSHEFTKTKFEMTWNLNKKFILSWTNLMRQSFIQWL